MNSWSNFWVWYLIEEQWLPYIETHQGILADDYFDVLHLFPHHPAITYRGLFADTKLQAAAVIYPWQDCLYISLLLTAPWNKIEKIKGAGSCLLRSLAIESRNFGTKGLLRLNATPNAVKFYQGLGFAIAELPIYPELNYPMILTPQAATLLIAANYVYPLTPSSISSIKVAK